MAVAAFRSGYSGKSLPEKLGFKAGMNAAFIALPAEHAGLADCTPFAKVVRADHWNARLSPKAFDAIHASRLATPNSLPTSSGCKRRSSPTA